MAGDLQQPCCKNFRRDPLPLFYSESGSVLYVILIKYSHFKINPRKCKRIIVTAVIYGAFSLGFGIQNLSC